jgi:HNH endonuclease
MTLLSHRPKPSRFVWHHIQPKAAGGPSTQANLVGVCDNCHYTIHDLMWRLSRMVDSAGLGTRKQRRVALQGYDACVKAGTVSKIPRES